ncbi:MAG: hypothetical protein DWQ07_10945 [Chloroflexi bacterium]|nr:MAG: hypothetical protein DWQ07_10945 [Chloroflexota bacterium]MBL1192769.1 hypothetical protein [Chloroflexota bacterium]NOH10063.1 hypothetical protein [Chloroflexota bacterium]
MNSRQRFLETLRFGSMDRVPLFEEGIRSEVLAAWHEQGLATGTPLTDLFTYDTREEIAIDLDTGLSLAKLSPDEAGLVEIQHQLSSKATGRMPNGWPEDIERWQQRQHCLMLEVHEGLFLSLGVGEWRSFVEGIYLLVDEPEFVREALMLMGDFAARLISEILETVEVDAVLFSEPIGGPHGALISPRMFAEIVLPGYAPILETVRKHKVEHIILRTYANTEALLPTLVEAGINCLWAVERGPEAMDYAKIRAEFGKGLGLIGGIDLDVLMAGEKEIQRELETKMLPLLTDGGYIPLADGRVRGEISFEAYSYYRQLLTEMTRA